MAVFLPWFRVGIASFPPHTRTTTWNARFHFELRVCLLKGLHFEKRGDPWLRKCVCVCRYGVNLSDFNCIKTVLLLSGWRHHSFQQAFPRLTNNIPTIPVAITQPLATRNLVITQITTNIVTTSWKHRYIFLIYQSLAWVCSNHLLNLLAQNFRVFRSRLFP